MRLGMKLQHANHGEINPVRPVVSAFSKKRPRLAGAKQLSLWKTPSELLTEHVASFEAAEEKRMAEQCESQFNYFMAERHYKTALDVLERKVPDNFPMSAAVARSLSSLYLNTERPSLARWYARRSMRICRAERHPMHPESIRCLASYGAMLFRLGQVRSAIRCLKRAYIRAAANESSMMVLSGDIIDLLADAYHATGNPQRAAYCERLSRRIRAEYVESPDTLTSLEELLGSRSFA